MKKYFIVLLVLLLLLSGCGNSSRSEKPDSNEATPSSEPLSEGKELPTSIKVPFSAEELKGQKCVEIRKKLEVLGFSEIRFADTSGNEIKEPDADSIAAYVSIGENAQFSLGDELLANQLVTIGILEKQEESVPAEEPTPELDEAKPERIQRNGFDESTNWTAEYGGMTLSIPSYLQEGKSNTEKSYTVAVEDNGTATILLFTKIDNCTEKSVFEIIDDVVDTSLQMWDEYHIELSTDAEWQGRRTRIVHATCQDEGQSPLDVYVTMFVESNTFYRAFLIQSPDAKYDYLNDYFDILEHIVFNEESSNTNKGNGNDNLVAKGTVGDSYIEVKGWEIKYDYSGKPALVLTYDWTNNSKDTTSALMSVSVKGFQKGVELDIGILLDNSVDTGSSLRDVRPGTTITVQEVFTLSDTESEVEFEISELWDFYGSSKKLEFSIPLK